MSSDNQFTALGPTEIGFQTNGTNIRMGASIAGREVGVLGHCDTGFGIEGTGGSGGVHGKGTPVPEPNVLQLPPAVGVLGESSNDNGVRGLSSGSDGVAGFTGAPNKSGVFGAYSGEIGTGFGVSGRSASPQGAGVNGFSDSGIGVRGSSGTNDGVVGSSSGDRKSGVFGDNTLLEGAAFGVSGRSASPQGAGVNGFSDQGYGGRFSGGRAPLRLEPANTPGRPTTGNHQSGELFVDSNGDLFFCKDSGTPGNWFQVQLTPV